MLGDDWIEKKNETKEEEEVSTQDIWLLVLWFDLRMAGTGGPKQ